MEGKSTRHSSEESESDTVKEDTEEESVVIDDQVRDSD